jgi:L-amino acid N-acyltransferase YncA
MIGWVYLLYRAARRQNARRAYRNSVQRSSQLRAEYTSVGAELLQALRAQVAAEERMQQILKQK